MWFSELFEEWRGFHQPINLDKYPDEVCRGDNIFSHEVVPDDLFEHCQNYLNTRDVSLMQLKSFMNFLIENQGNPDAILTVYRGQPSKILEYCSWVTPFESYAMNYAYDGSHTSKNSKVYKFKVRLHDISCDLDSLAEWGYFGKKVTGVEVR